MKKSIFAFFAIALTIAACSAVPPQVTVTSEVTVTLPPTNTPQPTETPQPQISPEVQAAQEFFTDKGFEVTPDGKVIDQATETEIAGFSIVAFDENTMINRGKRTQPKPTWALQRVYEFEDKTDFTVNMTEYDLKVENGVIDMYGWIYENGEFTRQKVEFAAPNNGTVKLDGYSPEEVQHMIKTDSSTAPEHRLNNVQGRSRIAIWYMGWKSEQIDDIWKIVYTYKGMREIKPYTNHLWGSNIVPELIDGEWVATETSEYSIVALGDRKVGLVGWYGKDGNGKVYAVEGSWIDVPEHFNKYWENNDWE